MNKKITFAILFIFLMPLINAIVIVPPVIYFVTLSIATFLANCLIALLAWLALSGFATKKIFGKKLSEMIAFLFFAIKRFLTGIFSMILTLFTINPIEIVSITIGAISAAIICWLILFLGDYPSFRIAKKEKKYALLKSATSFSAVIFVIFIISAFFSLQITNLTQTQSTQELNKIIPSLGDSSNDSRTDAPLQAPSKPKQEREITQIKKGNTLWFFPKNGGQCMIQIGSEKFNFTPKNNCYYLQNNLPMRIFCPEKISIEEIPEKGTLNVNATGSCNEAFEVIVNDGFEVK